MHTVHRRYRMLRWHVDAASAYRRPCHRSRIRRRARRRNALPDAGMRDYLAYCVWLDFRPHWWLAHIAAGRRITGRRAGRLSRRRQPYRALHRLSLFWPVTGRSSAVLRDYRENFLSCRGSGLAHRHGALFHHIWHGARRLVSRIFLRSYRLLHRLLH